MTVHQLVHEATRRGATFERKDDRLVVNGLARLPRKLQAEIRASRSRILKHLPEPLKPATLSDSEMAALGFSKLSTGAWAHNRGDAEGAAILALDRETLRPLIDEGTRLLNQAMIESGLRLPPIERITLRPGRHAGVSTFVRERGRRYWPVGF